MTRIHSPLVGAALLAALAAPALAQQAQGEPGSLDLPTVSVATSPEYGEYLVGPQGKPLYLFTTDSQGNGGEPAISCTSEACLEAWPLVTVEGEPRAGAKVDPDLLGTMEYERRTVATYNGWPLYTYVEDEPLSEPEGQDIHSFGGEWYLLTPEGEKLEAEG